MAEARAERIGTPKKWDEEEQEDEEGEDLPPPAVVYTPASSPGKLFTETENEWHAKFDKLQEAFQVSTAHTAVCHPLPAIAAGACHS